VRRSSQRGRSYERQCERFSHHAAKSQTILARFRRLGRRRITRGLRWLVVDYDGNHGNYGCCGHRRANSSIDWTAIRCDARGFSRSDNRGRSIDNR
jgi:hypothetical protein